MTNRTDKSGLQVDSDFAQFVDRDILAGLDKVGGHQVPAEGTRARDNKRLRGRVGGLEQLPEHRQRLAKGRDESGPDVALAGCARQFPMAGTGCGLPSTFAHL